MARRAPGGWWRRTIRRGSIGLLAADRGEGAEPGLAGVDDLGADARQRGRPLGEAGGGDDVRRRVDELAGGVDPAGDEHGAFGHGREVVAGAADHEALDAARRPHRCASAGRRSHR